MATQTLQSTNFSINYDPALKPNSAKRANAILSVCESELAELENWFGVSGGFGTNNRITVNVTGADTTGASNQGYKTNGTTNMTIDAQDANNNDTNAAEIVRMLFVAELVEILMGYRKTKGLASWNAGDSNGEGLSQLCAILRFRQGHALYYGQPWVNTWMQLPDRDGSNHDWISNPEKTDKNAESFGAALLFLFYLKDQLNHSVESIIQAGGSTLESTYKALTGQAGAITAFRNLLNPYFPIGKTPSLKTNDPFPLREPGRRQVTITPDAEPIPGAATRVRSGLASVSPYFTCPVDVYSYEIDSTPQALTSVATAKGFAQPVYRWRVNGVDVPNTGTIKPSASVTVDEPNAPGQKTTSVMPVPIDCNVTSDPFTSTLVMNFGSTVGHIDVTIEALAHEKYVSPEIETNGIDWVTVANEVLLWEARYYRDRQKCKDRVDRIIHDYVRVDPFFNILFTLPDPPQDYVRVLNQLQQLSVALKQMQRRSPAKARRLEQTLEATLGVKPALLRDFGKLSRTAPRKQTTRRQTIRKSKG